MSKIKVRRNRMKQIGDASCIFSCAGGKCEILLFVCTLVNALVLQGETPPAQVAQCQDHLGHKYKSRDAVTKSRWHKGIDLH